MPTQLRMDPDRFKDFLQESISRYDDLVSMPTNTEAERMALLAGYRNWDEHNKRLLDQAFEPVAWHETSPKGDYSTLEGIQVDLMSQLSAEDAPLLGRVADEKQRKLKSLLDSLDLYARSDRSIEDQPEPDALPAAGDGSRSIFVVHGRDKGAKEEVARFLERISDDRVVVLQEQPSAGRTIIEKLEVAVPADSFVVVVATADDEGRLRGDADLALRARQNVIFELGWAAGRFGRDHVAVLKEDGVEMPSDYYGVVYIAFESSGTWRISLVGELKTAGFVVDANKVFPS